MAKKKKKKEEKYLLLNTSNYLKTCSASFSQIPECLIAYLHPELLSGCAEGQQLQWLLTYSF